MAFDGIFLRQIVKQLQSVDGSHINKIYQISDTEILFILYQQKKFLHNADAQIPGRRHHNLN